MSSLILWEKSQILGVSRAVQAQKKYLVYIFFSSYCSAANSKSKKGHNCAKNILRVTSPIGMSSPFHNEQPVRVSSKYLQVMTEILQNVQVFARRGLRRRQSYDNTSSFSSKTAELKISREKIYTRYFFGPALPY